QILSWVGDNASSNDTQNMALGENPNNSFDTVNRVRCFNHTLNLAVKAFLKPFDLPEKKKKPVNDAASTHSSDSDNDNDDLNDFALEDEDDLPDLADAFASDRLDQEDDSDNSAWDDLDEEERTELLLATDSVKQVILRVRRSLYHSAVNLNSCS
ncbi:hypothetical protein B0H10DRAFT_1802167, partial [Mycena sp. CBHHK59/15]